MAKKNPIIQELRDLGVSDYERRKLRELARDYEADNTYSEIERLNQELLGERISPVTLNYETALRLLEYNVYGNIREIIADYKQAKMYVDQGTTTQYEQYIDKLFNELVDIGVQGITKDNLKNADLATVEYWYSYYKQYELVGNEAGMKKAKGELEKAIVKV